MFQSLADKLENAFKKFKGKGKLTESDVKEGMREIKLALLEADVNFKVVKEFMATVSERCVGAEVLESLTPTQHIVKIVNEELTRLMGGSVSKLQISSKPPTVVLMAGLQGAGKTTNCGKLAGLYKQKGKRPLLVACDIYRPAAIRQLQVVGEQLGIPVFTMPQGTPPVEIARKALEHAERYAHDMVFIDTAGRLHIDEALMDELKAIKAAVKPTEILLVVDAMTGQDAVNAATAFDEALGIDGVMLTNGPGDPQDNPKAIKTIRELMGKKPMFGICLGHQLMALAMGGRTVQMKYGHHGANHPVKDLARGTCSVTAQNHGFMVDPDQLPAGAVVSHLNWNDQTVEGVRYTDKNAFSVQFHPEACGGPCETAYLFDDFIAMIKANNVQ